MSAKVTSQGVRNLNSGRRRKRDPDRPPICPPCVPDDPRQVWDQREACFVLVVTCLSCGCTMDAKEI